MFILIGRTLFCPVAGFTKFCIHSIFPELGSIHVIQIKKSKRSIPVSQLGFEITWRSQFKKKQTISNNPLIMDLKCDLEWLDLEWLDLIWSDLIWSGLITWSSIHCWRPPESVCTVTRCSHSPDCVCLESSQWWSGERRA